MSDKERGDGGPAFPHSYAHGEYITDYGMTLRDYFAAKAMQGMLAGADAQEKTASANHFAQWAYVQADAMLAAREAK